MDGQSFQDPEVLLSDMGWVRGLARSLVADPQTADDLTQETWLAAWRREQSAGGPVPRAWLAQVLRNFARQRGRSEAARAARERAVASSEALPSSEALVERMERQRMLAEAVTRLAEPYRSTVILRFSEGLTPSAIARSLGVPAGTVRRRLKEALERLRADLDRGESRAAWMLALRPLFDEPSGATAGSSLLSGASLFAGISLMKALWISLIVAAGIAGTLLLTREAPDTEVVESAAGEQDSASLSELTAPADGGLAPVRRRADLDVEAATGTGAEGLEVSGRLELPARMEADPTLEVVALARAVDYRTLVAEDPAVLARSPVAEDGRFRMDLPAGREGVHLHVRGRWLYTPSSVLVDLPQTASVRIQPARGAWVTGAAAGAGSLRLIETYGLSPTASVARGKFAARAAARPDGSFEFRGVPVGLGYHCVDLSDTRPVQRAVVAGLHGLEHREIVWPSSAGAGRLWGHVFDADGKPQAGAQVHAILPGIFGVDEVEVRQTETDAEGRYELVGLPAEELLVVARAVDQLESLKLPAQPMVEDSGEGLDLVLGRGKELAGRVVGPDGEPVAGVRVEANFDRGFAFGAGGFYAQRGAEGAASTDGEGRFRLRGLGAGPFVLSAAQRSDDSDEMLWAEAREVRTGGERIELALRPLARLEGQVLDGAGAGLSPYQLRAARVVPGLLGEMAIDTRVVEVHSASGAFELQDLPPGVWVVRATSAELGTSKARVQVPRDAEEPLVLHANRGGVVRGIVLDPQGAPAPGARVQVLGADPRWMESVLADGPQPAALCDDEGRFELAALEPGALALVAHAPGFADSAAMACEALENAALGQGLELRLRSGGTLLGEVWQGDEPAPGYMMHAEHDASGAVAMGRTDVDGRFVLEHLVPGAWTVAAIDAQRGGSFTQEDVGEAELASLLQLTTVEILDGEVAEVVIGKAGASAVHVAGRVWLGDEPYGRVNVSLIPAGGASFDKLVFAQTDDAGFFEVDVRSDGLYSINVPRFPESSSNNTIDFMRHLPANSGTIEVTLRVPDAGIAGRVFDLEGKPAAKVRVTLLGDGRGPEGASPVSDGPSGGVYVEVVTDERGEYEFPGLRAGGYLVAAGGGGVDPRAETRELARTYQEVALFGRDEWEEDVDFHLGEGVSLQVQVVDEAGEPVRSATLFVRGADGRLLEMVSGSTTDGAGALRYGGLAPGDYTLFARTWDAASAESEVVSVDAEPGAPVVLKVAGGTRLRVYLTDPSGLPTVGSVEVFDAEGRDVGHAYALVSILRFLTAGGWSPTEPLFGPLPQGEYRIEARSFDGRKATLRVTLDGSETAECRVIFPAR